MINVFCRWKGKKVPLQNKPFNNLTAKQAPPPTSLLP